MRKAISIVVLLATISVAAQKKAEDKRFIGLDTAFARVLQTWHAAGFAVAVVEKNKVIYADGFGYRDYENKIPATPNTLFAIGSCTKAFTASLIGMLRKDGKLDYDKPVRSYLPELKFYTEEMTDKITLRDMMSHRTGLPRHDLSWYMFMTQSRDSLIQRIQYMEPSAALREKWQYNNFMFLVQGVVVEKLTGKSWEENIREKIFEPLGMASSVLTIGDLTKSKEPAIGYELKNDSIIKKTEYYHIDAMGPAGSINSSVNDMTKWLITWINAGKYNGKEIIPTDHQSEAISSQMIIGGGLPTKENPDLYFSNYGFGWFLSSYRGHYRVEHGGNIDGFTASTCFFPSDSVGIVVLCNQNSSLVPSIVRNLVADKMLKLKYYDWNSYLKGVADKTKKENEQALKSKIDVVKSVASPTHALKDYEGIYHHNAYGTFEVKVIRDSLFVFLVTRTWWLKHLQYDIFQPFDKDPKEGIDSTDKSDPLQFQMNTDGEIESVDLKLEPALKPISFTRTIKGKEISKDSLQKFVGEYALGGVIMKVFIKDPNTLYLFVQGQPEYELVAIDKNKFSIKALTGYSIQFNANAENEIIELLAIQPNGTFKATKKK
jgi:CubicO group peptidase (beta-lactamase class C family)